MPHDHITKSRLITKVIRDFLQEQQFVNMADLSEAVKYRLLDLKIQARPSEIDEALRLMEAPAHFKHGLKPVIERHEQVPDSPTLSRLEAAQVYHRLLARHRSEHPREDVPGAPEHFPQLMRVTGGR